MTFRDEFTNRNILSRQQWKILDKAKQDWREMTARQALEIARNQQRNNSRVEDKTLYLTEMGKFYSNFTSEERAMYRRAKETGRPMSHYKYVEGRVLLKDEYKKRL